MPHHTDDSQGCASLAQALSTVLKAQLCCAAEPVQQGSMNTHSTEKQMLCQPVLTQCLLTLQACRARGGAGHDHCSDDPPAGNSCVAVSPGQAAPKQGALPGREPADGW